MENIWRKRRLSYSSDEDAPIDVVRNSEDEYHSAHEELNGQDRPEVPAHGSDRLDRTLVEMTADDDETKRELKENYIDVVGEQIPDDQYRESPILNLDKRVEPEVINLTDDEQINVVDSSEDEAPNLPIDVVTLSDDTEADGTSSEEDSSAEEAENEGITAENEKVTTITNMTETDENRRPEENNADVVPVEDDDCIEIIGTTFTSNNTKAATSQAKPLKIVGDLSKGREKYNIPVYNQFNDEVIDPHFRYSTQSVRLSSKIDVVPGCKCKDGCDENCACRQLSTIRVQDGLISSNMHKLVTDPMRFTLVECRSNCRCKGNCSNRFTQRQIQHRIELDYMKDKGFGVRIRECAFKGQYFCEYVGEILYKEKHTADTVYQYGIALPENNDEAHCFIDARRISNAARFINHSCTPILAPFLFIRNIAASFKYPQLGFYFLRDVIPGEELSIDYGPGYFPNLNLECRCRTTSCKHPPAFSPLMLPGVKQEAERQEAEVVKMREKHMAEYKKCEERRTAIREGRMTVQEVLDEINREAKAKRMKKKKQRITGKVRCCSPMAPWPPKGRAMSPPPINGLESGSRHTGSSSAQFEDLPSTSRQVFPVFTRKILRDVANTE